MKFILSVIDPGTPFSVFKDYLNFNYKFISHYKFAWGSSLLLDDIPERVRMLESKGVSAYCGGTLFEIAYMRGEINEYKTFLKRNGFSSVEISSGTVCIQPDELLCIVDEFASDFNVLVEVGKKDQSQSENMYPEMWIDQINSALSRGAQYIVLEGRESSSAGIFRPNGELRKGLLLEIFRHCPIEKLVFEAPVKKDQVALLDMLSYPLGFGNIPLQDVVKVIALVRGLRSDTLRVDSLVSWSQSTDNLSN